MEILLFPAIFFLLILLPAYFADKALETKKQEEKQKETKMKEEERKAEREAERKEREAQREAQRALDTEDKQKHNYFVDTQFLEYISSKLSGYNVMYITGYKETICRNGLSVSFIHRIEGNDEKRETVIIPAPLAS